MEGLLEIKVMMAIEKQGRAIVDVKAPEIAQQYLEEFKSRFGNASALGLSAKAKEQEVDLPKWMDWTKWFLGYQQTHNAPDPVLYQSVVASPLAETGEGKG